MILITHDDLDGIGCAVLALVVNPETKVYICSYDNVNNTVSDILAEDDELFITDLSINQEIAEKLNERGRVTLLDHHQTATWLNQYSWAKVVNNCCGTALLYDHLTSNGADLKSYADFVSLVHDHDMWIHDDPKSRQLNRLLQILGTHRFVSRFFTQPQVDFTQTEQFLLEMEEEKIQDYCNSTAVYQLLDMHDNRFIFACAERYVSELAEYLLNNYSDYKYVMIANLNTINPKISLRSRGDFDVAEMAQKYGGGGHKASAGFHISPEVTIPNLVVSIVSQIINKEV